MLPFSLFALMIIFYIVAVYALNLDSLNTVTQKSSAIVCGSIYDSIVHERGHDPLNTRKDVSHA